MSEQNRKSLIITAPFKASVVTHACPEPHHGQVLVKALKSGISAGTEMLAYRGELPQGIPLDESISEMHEEAKYPLSYGYSVVGRVIALGEGVDKRWLRKKVFAFHPHESLFVTRADNLLELPEGLRDEDAIFLANTETAVGLLMDGRPMVGERVLIVGLGVIGLLLGRLIKSILLSQLIGVDPLGKRRASARISGLDVIENTRVVKSNDKDGFDLVYETTGTGSGLQAALDAVGYAGRVVVASWYGRKAVTLDLGAEFHRSKAIIYPSQVSKIDPRFSGRWDKQRRMQVALRLLQLLQPRDLITHQFSISEADKAYQVIDNYSQHSIQVLLTY